MRPPASRRHTHKALENSREMRLIRKAVFQCDLRRAEFGARQVALRRAHAFEQPPLMRRLARRAFECPDEIGARQLHAGREIVDAQALRQVDLHMRHRERQRWRAGASVIFILGNRRAHGGVPDVIANAQCACFSAR
nr:hypothetical protein [Paraburkholderia bannensis]